MRDIGLQKENCSSLPLHKFRQNLFYSINSDLILIQVSMYVFKNDTEELVFVSCKNPVKSQPNSKFARFVNTESCNYTTVKNDHTVSYDYVGLASNLVGSDIEESCTLNLIAPASMEDKSFFGTNQDPISFEKIHNLLADGFRVGRFTATTALPWGNHFGVSA